MVGVRVDDDDVLTLSTGHFPKISPVVTKQATKRVSTEEKTNKIIRAPQYQYTKGRYYSEL